MLHLPDRDVSVKMLPDRDVSVKMLPDRKIVTCIAKDLGTPRSCLKLLDDPNILSNRKPARN